MASFFRSSTTYDPILFLLNADKEEERDELTEKWKDSKLAELNFIGIVGALLAGVLTSTGSWPTILPNGTRSPWTVRTCWYCGIILALFSVLTAAQQSIRLHRLCGHRDALKNIRKLLCRKHRGPNGQIMPRIAQVYIWQLSVVLLTGSVLAMLGGMFVLIWSSTGHNAADEGWWNDEAKVAVTFSTVAFVAFVLLFTEQITLYTFSGNDDNCDQSETGGPSGQADDEAASDENGSTSSKGKLLKQRSWIGPGR